MTLPGEMGPSLSFFCAAMNHLEKCHGDRLLGKDEQAAMETMRKALGDAEAAYCTFPKNPVQRKVGSGIDAVCDDEPADDPADDVRGVCDDTGDRVKELENLVAVYEVTVACLTAGGFHTTFKEQVLACAHAHRATLGEAATFDDRRLA